jgi:hypothetical protein
MISPVDNRTFRRAGLLSSKLRAEFNLHCCPRISHFHSTEPADPHSGYTSGIKFRLVKNRKLHSSGGRWEVVADADADAQELDLIVGYLSDQAVKYSSLPRVTGKQGAQ